MNLALGLGKLTGAAIKKRRAARIARGQRVVGQRVRNRLLSAGVNLPIPASSVQAPQTIATMTRQSTVVKDLTLTRTELVQTVASPVATFQRVSVPIMAGNEQWFPSLAAIASQYQFYRFKKVTATYTPVCSTDTVGQIALAFVPRYDTAESIQSMGEFLSYPSVKSSVWDGTNVQVTATQNTLNQTYLKQGYVVANMQEADLNDEQLVQGVLVYAHDNTPAASTMLGTIQLSYVVELIKPRTQVGATSAVCAYNRAGTFAQWGAGWDVGTALHNPVITMANTDANNNVITVLSPGDYLMSFFGVGSIDVTLALAATLPTTSIVNSYTSRHINGAYYYIWHVKTPLAGSTLTLTSSAGANHTQCIGVVSRLRRTDVVALGY